MEVVSPLQKCLRRVFCRKIQPTIPRMVVLRLICSGQLQASATTRCTLKILGVGQVFIPGGTADLSLAVSTAIDPIPHRQALSSRARLCGRRHEATRRVNPLTSDVSPSPTPTIDILLVHKVPILEPSAQRPLVAQAHSMTPTIEPRTTYPRKFRTGQPVISVQPAP